MPRPRDNLQCRFTRGTIYFEAGLFIVDRHLMRFIGTFSREHRARWTPVFFASTRQPEAMGAHLTLRGADSVLRR